MILKIHKNILWSYTNYYGNPLMDSVIKNIDKLTIKQLEFLISNRLFYIHLQDKNILTILNSKKHLLSANSQEILIKLK